MKRTLLAAIVITMSASTAFAQRAAKSTKPATNPARSAAPKAANKVDALKASKTDAALAGLQALTAGQLTAEESKLTCDGTSDNLVKLVSENLSGSEKAKFLMATQMMQKAGGGIQSCRSGEPITQRDSLVNLGKVTIKVWEYVESNQGIVNDIKTWAKALKAVIPTLTEEQSEERAGKLAGSPCNIIKAS